MCIRDRLPVTHGPEYTRLHVLLYTLILLGVSLLPFATRMSCLLYTSDAADERSSVDLGGRRIIKKKRSQSQQTGSHSKVAQRVDALQYLINNVIE